MTSVPTAPSAAVETLQRELARLDYYEGSFTGTMNNQTVVAITYLQRDAGLPGTGTMNAATQQALATMLAQGNNQMGSLSNRTTTARAKGVRRTWCIMRRTARPPFRRRSTRR